MTGSNSYKLHDYQERVRKRLLENGIIGLLWDMGVGKTLTTLAALDSMPVHPRTLIIAPKRCCTRVWPTEIERWGFPASFALLLGERRKRLAALHSDADIKIINPENIPWLYDELKASRNVPFDAVVVDESTDFKNPTSKRFKSLQQMLPHIPCRMILTGTPIPKNYTDLWAQTYILDLGKSLGKNITAFRRRFCAQDFWKQWHVRPECTKEIDAAISHLVDRIDAADHLTLPPLTYNRIVIELPPKVKQAYDQGLWEIQQQQTPEDGFDSSGAEFTRLRTLCSGFAYVQDELNPDAPRETRWLHDEKIKAIGEIHQGIGGKPLLVAFNFRAEREALVDAYGCAFIDGAVSGVKGDALVDQWCRGELPMLAIHPGAVKYGLNMQAGGCHMAWISLPTSLADWQQTNARLFRQGQKQPVTIHSVVANDTIDSRLIGLLETKETTQDMFLTAMKNIIKD